MPPEQLATLEDLSARVLAHIDTAALVADIRVRVASIDAKLDSMMSDLADFSEFRKQLEERRVTYEQRMGKVEGSVATHSRLIAAAWAFISGLVISGVGAVATWIMSGGHTP